MAWGFKVVNDAGTVLIDDTYANLALMSSTVYQTGAPSGIGFGSDLTFSFAAEFPVFAFRCESAYATVYSVQQSGSTYTVKIRCSGGPGTVIRVYLFDRPVNPTSGWGIRVRDSAGRITFDSGYSYMRIDGAYATQFANPPAQWTLPAGKSYAVVQGGFLYSQYWFSLDPPTDPNARGEIITEISGTRLSGNVLTVSTWQESSLSLQPSYQGGWGGTAALLLVDVTDL